MPLAAYVLPESPRRIWAHRWPRSWIAISRAAMGDPQCENHQFRILDCLDDPVVGDPDVPQVWISNDRSRAARMRVAAQGFDSLDDAAR